MFSKFVLFSVIYTISYIIFFVIYFLQREYSIAKKMFNTSAARKYLQKKILPFSLIGILIMSVSLPAYLHLPEKLIPVYMLTLYNLFFCSLFLIISIDFMISKSSFRRIIFIYIDKKQKEKNFSLFIISLSSSIALMLLISFQKPIDLLSICFVSVNLLSGLNCLISSFNKLKIVEEGIIHKFRLMKWDSIRAYKNISDSLDWDRNPVFKITLRVKPSVWHMSSFVQIPVNPQDIDSINQILVERLPGKNL
jgi:hypothetical protein